MHGIKETVPVKCPARGKYSVSCVLDGSSHDSFLPCSLCRMQTGPFGGLWEDGEAGELGPLASV